MPDIVPGMEPITIEGVDAERVGSPRNDGTRGSGLYIVPIKLSRKVSGREARLLEAGWDHPPQFTMMHRPGILRASGDTIILDGTTVEEVREYHAATLKLVVAAVNAQEAQLVMEDAARAKAEADAAAAHRANVADVARDMNFD